MTTTAASYTKNLGMLGFVESIPTEPGGVAHGTVHATNLQSCCCAQTLSYTSLGGIVRTV